LEIQTNPTSNRQAEHLLRGPVEPPLKPSS
jgi:hypothetical protein